MCIVQQQDKQNNNSNKSRQNKCNKSTVTKYLGLKMACLKIFLWWTIIIRCIFTCIATKRMIIISPLVKTTSIISPHKITTQNNFSTKKTKKIF